MEGIIAIKKLANKVAIVDYELNCLEEDAKALSAVSQIAAKVNRNVEEKKKYTEEEVEQRERQLNYRKDKYLQQIEDKRQAF